MTIIVTGGAGFIGSNIVSGLNRGGIDDVIVVDDLTDSAKVANLTRVRIADYVDYEDFYGRFESGDFGKLDAVFHQGACSDTMEHDGRYMMKTNYRCSKQLLDACMAQSTPLIYASSAAVYGNSTTFSEEASCEAPLNVYGYSKLLFDHVTLAILAAGSAPQIVGFRYFNVYGPGEAHKGRMASVAYHQFNRLKNREPIELFGAHDGYEAGEQSRDFIHVDDIVKVNLWAFAHPDLRGVFNLGTGRAQTFNDVAKAAIGTWTTENGSSAAQREIRYVDFPDALKGKYQSYTRADLSRLRAAGYDGDFLSVEEGVKRYIEWLIANSGDASPRPR